MKISQMGCLLACVVVASAAVMNSAQAQASFNCRIADRPDEVLICQNPELSALDRTMSSRYFRLRNRFEGSELRHLESDQRDWLRSRMGCGRDFGCIRSAYLSRIEELRSYRGG